MREKILLKNYQSPGDILMLTAAVRDLFKAHATTFEIGVDTSCPDLWTNNPYLSDFHQMGEDVRKIDCEYPLVHESNTSSFHFIHGFRQDLEAKLGVSIPAGEFKGDIHLSAPEKQLTNQVEEKGIKRQFWILNAGGKTDYTCKWWSPESWQKVVDHFGRKIVFVQVGEKNHWHPPLKHTLNLIGKTDLRQFIRLVYHSVGVVCGVTMAMHAAAAVPVPEGQDRPLSRACVVVAGGREPQNWEQYSHHRFLSTNGALKCCDSGGCWKSRCQLIGDGDDKDKEENRCVQPIQVKPGLLIPRCMDIIKPEDVIRNIEMYYTGGALNYGD